MKNSFKKSASQVVIIIVVLSSIIFAALTVSSTQKDNRDIFKGKVFKAVINDDPITFSSQLNNRYYYDNNNVYLNLEVKSSDVSNKAIRRTPLNVSVVIDKSGSMAEKNKLDFVKKAVEHIIDELENDYYVSIVTYNDYVSIILESGRIEDKSSNISLVSNIQSGGFTNLSGGMLKGFKQVESTYRRGYVNRVLLLSDGIANRGVSDRAAINDLVREQSRKYGITISTFGVGNDFNENLMADIADYGKGNYYYIKESEEIPRIFASELKGVRYLTGQDSKIRVKFPSDYLTVSKVYGYPYEIFGDEIVIDLKDVFAGQNKTVLIKFDIRKKFAKNLKFKSDFEYLNPEENLEKVSKSISNTLEPVSNEDEFKKGFELNVQQSVVVFEANELMEQALKEADNGNYSEARAKLKESKDYMSKQDIQPSPGMQKQEKNIDEYGKQLESADKKTEEEKKEMQKSGKYENYGTRKNQ
jgi:Ca-activated chloride channel homolog